MSSSAFTSGRFAITHHWYGNETGVAAINCYIEDFNQISKAEPVVRISRKPANGSYFEFVPEYVSVTGKNYSFLVESVQQGETFVCTLHDVNNYRSLEIKIQPSGQSINILLTTFLI